MLSFIAFNDPNAEVRGLDQFPRDEWPPVVICHISFQIMVGIGMVMAALAVLYAWYRRRPEFPRWYLRILVWAIPLGMIAIEAGWVVTEVGRQPWIVYGLIRTRDAVTPMPGVTYHFGLFLVLYFALAAATAWLFRRQVLAAQRRFTTS
jgi:cytochrome d ubiquinol oxidase subunit I